MPQFLTSYDNPKQRYGALSQMLSGVSLYPNKPNNASDTFFDIPEANLFCGKWSPNEIANVLADTGCFAHWHKHAYSNIWIETSNRIAANRYELEVWTQIEEKTELLMLLVVWLDYIEIERLKQTLPQFHIEHLLLQLPQTKPVDGLWPGQDFPSSGALRRIFGVLKYWASALGASLITGIPAYFHTAYLFSEFFEFIDPEMEGLFRGIVRDFHVTPSNMGDITRAFESENILYNGKKWLWPTEMQAYSLSHALTEALHVSNEPCEGHFSIQAAARMQ